METILNDVLFMDAVQYITTVLFAALAVWLLAQLAPSTVRGLKDAWHVARKYRPDVIAAVDQPTDPLIRWLSRLTGADAGNLSNVLPRVLRAMADALDEATGFEEPQPEHIPSNAPKEAIK